MAKKVTKKVTTKRPYFLSSEISVISILGLLKSNTTQTLLMG